MDWNSLPLLSAAREKQLRKLGSRKQRREQGLFVAEGVRLVEEALSSGAEIEWAVAAETGLSRSLDLISELSFSAPLYRASERELAGLLDTITPQPVAAVCRIPDMGLTDLEIPEESLLVVCDNLRDPGNFGAIVRTAAAAGCTAVVAAGSGVDPWNPKAVRGSMGAVFRLPVIESAGPGELAGFFEKHGFSGFLADMAGDNLFDATHFPSRCALVMGGEAEGAGDSLQGVDYTPLSVPMTEGTESLNVAVAAGIMIYQITQRMGGRRAN